MKQFELRLAEQHCRNARHVKNLRSFCEDQNRFGRLDHDDQVLLAKQLDLMEQLDKVLQKRMERLNLPV